MDDGSLLKRHAKTLFKINRILEFCKIEQKHFDEISEHLGGMNNNTLRAKYIYPLVNSGQLIKVKKRVYKTNLK